MRVGEIFYKVVESPREGGCPGTLMEAYRGTPFENRGCFTKKKKKKRGIYLRLEKRGRRVGSRARAKGRGVTPGQK